MNIALTPVKSSNIRAVGYDPATRTLAVEFPNSVYHYADVPPNVHDELRAAESVGRYFASNVKGKFEHSKVVPEKKPEGG